MACISNWCSTGRTPSAAPMRRELALALARSGQLEEAREVLSGLLSTTPPDADGMIHLTLAVAEESIQRKAVVYDADGDAHYDTASAFIKSIRGSDPDAALYWLAKMLHAGEDPRFVSRRLVISASEDIGLADSGALRVALGLRRSALIGPSRRLRRGNVG
jgi:putative ATPase